MDAVKRKVMSELFLAPSVVLPIVGGVSAGLLSWASGGSSYLTGAAIAGVLGGVGWMLTRMIFKIEDITEQAMQAEMDSKLQRERRELDHLAEQLRRDRDHRTQDFLTLLRAMRDDFELSATQPGLQFRSGQVRQQVDAVFCAAVDQLRQSFRLWELSENLVGQAREKILADREEVLKEIEVTVDRMQAVLKQFNEMTKPEANVDLKSMREELEATMRIAKRTEQRMREIENPSAAYEEFVRD